MAAEITTDASGLRESRVIHINVARATIAGLKALRRPDEVARMRGLDAEDFVPAALLDSYRRTEAGIGPSASGSDEAEEG